MTTKVKITVDKWFSRLCWLANHVKYKCRFRSQTYRIKLFGGLGDIIGLAPFIASYSKSRNLQVYYKDSNHTPKPKSFSEGVVRKYETAKGEKINAMREYLQQIKGIDLTPTTNFESEDAETWYIYDTPFFFGGHLRPEEYRKKFRDKLLSKENIRVAKEITSKYQKHKFCVIHLRRNADKVLTTASLLAKNNAVNWVFIIVGSSIHEEIPPLPKNLEIIDLTDNHLKGYGLLDIFAVIERADLFIGGRGGFELFAWNMCVPSINFFDKIGFQEVIRGSWSKYLWEDNLIPELFSSESKPQNIIHKYGTKINK